MQLTTNNLKRIEWNYIASLIKNALLHKYFMIFLKRVTAKRLFNLQSTNL